MAKRVGSLNTKHTLFIRNSYTSLSPCRDEKHCFSNAIRFPSAQRSSYSNSAPIADKDLFRDVLHSSTTKRDARSFLNKFSREKSLEASRTVSPRRSSEVNLGKLFGSPRAASPVWCSDAESNQKRPFGEHEAFHTALVKVRALTMIGLDALNGIGRTLSQLSKLGMSTIVVVDPLQNQHPEDVAQMTSTSDPVAMIVDAIQESGGLRAQRMDGAFEFVSSEKGLPVSSTTIDQENLRLSNDSLLLSMLTRGVIPVISPTGLSFSKGLQLVNVDANAAMLALVKHLGKIQTGEGRSARTRLEAISSHKQKNRISLDRVILLDPLGGTPSVERAPHSHVYINLRQEYWDIKADLNEISRKGGGHANTDIHSRNIDVLWDSLKLLPESSSGLITTPKEVLMSQAIPSQQSTGLEVQTRRKRNPLIHNYLTDKPAISSSLPQGRSLQFGQDRSTSTFVKYGVPVTIIPDLKTSSWTRPPQCSAALSLDDSRINLAKLVHLIEASFRRTLDVNHFMSRTRDRLAGIVVAGEYEGCALFTWESPPGSAQDVVPYLDKFAVLPEHQGTGACISDVLFQAMVMDCFPEGVVWRSRASNPVNKWYFERANGTWKIPGTKWTCFWTMQNPTKDDIKVYEAVCRAVEPSWAG